MDAQVARYSREVVLRGVRDGEPGDDSILDSAKFVGAPGTGRD